MIGELRQTLRRSAVLWHVLNVPARISHWKVHQRLTAAETRVVRELSTHGIAAAHRDELFPPQVFQELRAFAGERRARIGALARAEDVAKAKKASFLVDLGDRTFDLNQPFIRFSLSRPVLNIVESYLGMWPKFREFFLQATVPVPSGTNPFSSQRWHADPDDRAMVKVFLYINDVDEGAGPFTYIRGTHGRGKWRNLFPYAPKQKTRHPDPAFIERTIPADDILTMTGRAGTVIFCDTSGIHRGGYATVRERIMYTSVYTTRASALPRRFTPPDALPPLEPRVRYALSV